MKCYAMLGPLLAVLLSLVFSMPARAQEPEIGPIGTSLAQSVGLNQNVVVVMCEYLDNETPFTREDPADTSVDVEIQSAEDFVEIMEGPVNDYYLDATHQPSAGQGVTSFAFIPVPGKCQFDFTYNGIVDDPTIMEREFSAGARYADEALPGVFDTTSRVIVVVNGDKRARAVWAHWPFVLPNSGLTMLRAAVIGTEAVKEPDFSTIAHELGHQLGLPDLYQLDGAPGQLVGQWGEMGQDRMQNFTAYSRYMANWIEDPGNRVITITPSTVPAGPIRLDLPGNDNGNPELIRIDASSMEASPLPSPFSDAIGYFVPFIGYYVEFRDPSITQLDLPIDANGYDGGMLVFRHTDWLNTETGFSPRPLTVMHPTQTAPVTNPESAAFPIGTPFVDPAMGLTVTPLGANADGSIDVLITWTPPPRPDIIITDLRLDSPVNGLGVFVEPLLFGDPLMSTTTMNLSSVPPSVSAVTPPHSMQISFGNIGSGSNPAGMTGALWLLEPTIPVPFDLTNPASLLPFRTANIPFTVPVIASGGSSTVTVTVNPSDSFLAVAIVNINSAETDLQLLNNVYHEPFLEVPVLAFASPYPSLDIEHKVTNINKRDHLIGFSMNLPKPLPEGWTLDVMDNARMLLKSGESGHFKLSFTPPLPDILKPGQIGQLPTTAWMDEGDSFIPVMNVPRYFMLNASTAVSLESRGGGNKYEFSGELVQMSNGVAVDSLANQRINLTISRENGSDIQLETTTGANGRFNTSYSVKALSDVHGAIAQFPGTSQFAEAISEPLVFFKPVNPAPQLSSLMAEWKGGKLLLVAELTSPSRRSLSLKVESSNPRLAKAAPIRIDAGKTTGLVEVQFANRIQRSTHLRFAVGWKGKSLETKVSPTRPGAFGDLLRER